MEIEQFYTNKSIFLTGVTGFIGKVYLYKIISQFPNIKRVFVLIRGKKD